MDKEKRNILEMNAIDAYISYDNLDTALEELNNANYVMSEYVEDEDTKKDYFSSISRTQLVLEQITWSAFIDLLIANIKLNGSDEHSALANRDVDIIKLEELKKFLKETMNLLKELM